MEVVVGRQQFEVVPETQLRQKRIDRSDLDSSAATFVAQGRGLDVILTIRHDQRQRRETIQDLIARLRASKPLKNFLQYEPGGVDGFPCAERRDESTHLRQVPRGIPPQSQRPDARVDEQFHPRERSAL